MQSLCLIGALFGSLLAWPTSEFLGRKTSLMLSGIPVTLGWLMIALAHLAPRSSTFYGVLLTGRMLTGVFYGWTSVCVPVSFSIDNRVGGFSMCAQNFVDRVILYVVYHELTCHIPLFIFL
jgi:MFS family permease